MQRTASRSPCGIRQGMVPSSPQARVDYQRESSVLLTIRSGLGTFAAVLGAIAVSCQNSGNNSSCTTEPTSGAPVLWPTYVLQAVMPSSNASNASPPTVYD